MYKNLRNPVRTTLKLFEQFLQKEKKKFICEQEWRTSIPFHLKSFKHPKKTFFSNRKKKQLNVPQTHSTGETFSMKSYFL